MRLVHPRLVQGNMHQQVAVGEKVVVRGPMVYKLPPKPNWVNGNERLNWLEKLIDGLIHRGWFKNSDIYVRIDLETADRVTPMAYIIPSNRREGAIVLNGENARDLMEDAKIFDRLRDGALFLKVSP